MSGLSNECLFYYSCLAQLIESQHLFNDWLKPSVTQSAAVSEPFELRLLLSLKNDKNILSYSLLYRAFHNDCWQDAVPWLELSCTCFSLSQMQDILTSEPVPLVDSLLSTLIFYNNRINGQHLCLLLPCAWHIGFMRYSGDGGIFANLQLDLAFKIPEPKSQCEVMQYAEHTSFFLFFFFSLFPGRYLL